MLGLSKRQQGGIAAGVLLIALVVGVLAFGGGDDDEPADETTADSTLPTTTTPTETQPDPPDKPKDKPQDGGNEGNSPGGADEAALPSDQQAPETPYGPPGTPAGTVPPGADLSADEQAVNRTLHEFVDAIKRGNGPQACAQLSREGRAREERSVRKAAPETTGTPCEGSIVLYQGGYQDEVKDPTFRDLRVSGSKATALGPLNEDAALTKYRRTWLIDNYGW